MMSTRSARLIKLVTERDEENQVNLSKNADENLAEYSAENGIYFYLLLLLRFLTILFMVSY